MALVPSGAVQSKPELDLSIAIRDYESILSDEQRRRLHSEGPPGVTAAIELATTLDRECNEIRKHCMGPRIMLFLEFIQQFYSSVDTFVSSHPEFAALVWGGVKITILAANNIATYFDSISTLFMNLGRQNPRIQSLGNLYPTEGLRRAGYDYSTAVMKLCKQIMLFLKKSAFQQWSRALFFSFKSEFGHFEAELANLSQAVRGEASLASKQAQKIEYELQAKERTENRKSRALIRKLGEIYDISSERTGSKGLEMQRWRVEAKKTAFLISLSTHDFETSFRSIRRACVQGTCRWICEDPKFAKWMKGGSSSLQLKGKLGSGKSTYSSSVISHLVTYALPNDIISYFFCQFDDEASLKSDTILGCLLQQMALDFPAEKFQASSDIVHSRTEMFDFVECSLSTERRYFIVIDGIDECEELQIREVADFVGRLFTRSDIRVKLFISTRLAEPISLQDTLSTSLCMNLETIESQVKISDDTERLIDATLEGWLTEEGPDLVGDPNLILTIREVLIEKTNGMFLWLKLQLQILRQMDTDQEILASLNDLPNDLSETFDRLLSRRQPRNQAEDIRSRIFQWVAVAKRPLSLGELREAISVKSLQRDFDPQMMINDMQKAIAKCRNLVIVDEELHTVHFAHSSVKQYLLSEPSVDDKSSAGCYVNLEHAEAQAGAICVTYLNFPAFERQISRNHNVNLNDVPVAVITNSLPSGSKRSNRMALRLLKHRNKSGKTFHDLFQTQKSDDSEHFFLSYARQFWMHHTRQYWRNDAKYLLIHRDEELWKLWCNLIGTPDSSENNNLQNLPWTANDIKEGRPIVADWIVQNRHWAMARFVLEYPLDTPRKIHTEFLLLNAASRGGMDFVESCLEGEHMLLNWDLLGRSLIISILGGHVDVVARLLRRDASLIECCIAGRTWVLMIESEGTSMHLARTETLQQARLYGSTSSPETTIITPFQIAVEQQNPEIVEELVKYPGIFSGNSPLSRAAELGNSAIVTMLLKAGADVSKGWLENSPLRTAAWAGHPAVVRILLQAGANVNAQEFYDDSIIMVAASGGHAAVVKILLEAGANIDQKDSEEHTALINAAERGHTAVVRILLEAHANINQQTSGGYCALMLAAETGNTAMAQILLEAGADHTLRTKAGGRGKTAKAIAKQKGYKNIVALLVAAEERTGKISEGKEAERQLKNAHKLPQSHQSLAEAQQSVL